MKTFATIFALAMLLTAYAPLGHAQWSSDPTVNTPVCTATGAQITPTVISDEAGGIITAWADQRVSSSTPNVYAQRMSSSGVAMWTTNGVSVAPTAAFQSAPAMISDGRGGAIIAWGDARNGNTNTDIYAQRISFSGALLWGATGKGICTAPLTQGGVVMVSDNNGGAILMWNNDGFGSSDVYGQRIDSSGNSLWAATGIVITAASGSQAPSQLVSDGQDGAIVVWKDFRNGSSNTDIFAQRVNGSGVVQWTTNGVAICTAGSFQIDPSLCSDGSSGAFITWSDHRGLSYDIYAQRVNATGSPQWAADGIIVCDAAGDQSRPSIVTDSLGTAVIAWGDPRTTANRTDVYAQRINSAGTAFWGTNGLAICATTGVQGSPFVASDELGGVMLTWEDSRVTEVGNSDVYGQRVSSTGVIQWTTNGVPISTATHTQIFSQFICNGTSGAIVVWEDRRIDDTNGDIYAAHVNANGTLTSVRLSEQIPLSFSLEQNYPNPFNPTTTIKYQIPTAGDITLKVFNLLGQEVATLVNENLMAGQYEVKFDATGLSSGVYFYRLTSGTQSISKKLLLTK